MRDWTKRLWDLNFCKDVCATRLVGVWGVWGVWGRVGEEEEEEEERRRRGRGEEEMVSIRDGRIGGLEHKKGAKCERWAKGGWTRGQDSGRGV